MKDKTRQKTWKEHMSKERKKKFVGWKMKNE